MFDSWMESGQKVMKVKVKVKSGIRICIHITTEIQPHHPHFFCFLQIMWSSWLSRSNINCFFRSAAESTVFPPLCFGCTSRKAARIPYTALHSAEWSNTHSLLSQIIIRVPALLLRALSLALLNIEDFQLSTGWVLKRPAIQMQTYRNMHMRFSSYTVQAGIETVSIRVPI